MKSKLFIMGQAILIVVAVVGILMFYPRAKLDLEGNSVRFNSINANVIVLSSNSDFSNPRYVDIDKEISFNLKPGKYYWKASNGVIEGFSKEFKIDSEVGLEIINKDGNAELKNVGDVKINVSRTKDGGFVGHIILEPEESEMIENKGEYVGRGVD